MPDRMSNRMSEDMSDRMPEDLPVRKCINVMVGITRSKVISLHQPSPSTASIPLHLLLSLHPVFISLKAQGLNTDGLGKK